MLAIGGGCASHLPKQRDPTVLTITVSDLAERIAIERKYQGLFPFPEEKPAAEYHRGRGDSLQDLIQLAKDRAAQ